MLQIAAIRKRFAGPLAWGQYDCGPRPEPSDTWLGQMPAFGVLAAAVGNQSRAHMNVVPPASAAVLG